jgi:hypothetical protein
VDKVRSTISKVKMHNTAEERSLEKGREQLG